MVGYHNESTNYRIFNPATNQVITAKNVIINEGPVQDTNDEGRKFDMPIDKVRIVTSKDKPKQNPINGNTDEIEQIHLDEESEDESDIRTNDVRTIENLNRKDRYNLRKQSSIKQPFRYEACFTLSNEPKSFQEAILGEHSDDWKSAIQEELRAHKKNNT